ncbi:MAG: divalent metal cation transporter [Chloroflexi bacterium CFX7]|nr:divalent metal cation transporter [Chloroflexi bacterium CFX7]MCK6563870.1 divalent metal cation transporter [Dehalococcoidia bacterium]RIL03270.1 MAG: Mn transporter [bacterium]
MPGDEREAASTTLRGRGSRLRLRATLLMAVMGPGLITGIVNNDATGIAGYSLAGAKFGYSLFWALVVSTLALGVVQELVARMGAVTGKGLADLIREQFGVRVALLAMLTLLLVNSATVVAEFAGVAAASEIFGLSRYASVPLAAALVFALVAYGSYRKVEVALLSISLVYITYFVTGFMADPAWPKVARGMVPGFELDVAYLTILIALIGTTITPWEMFYNQASVVDKGLGKRELRYIAVDSYAGAASMAVIAFFIMLTTAATLWTNGRPAGNVEEVAQALHPLAGDLAAELFAVGLLNAALMAMAVLPLTTAYAICEAFGWERSVNRGVREAPAFFGIFGGLLAVGALAVLIPGLPLLVLIMIPNVAGGVLLPIILVLALKLVNDEHIMGEHANTPRQNIIGVVTTAGIVVLTAVYLMVLLLTGLGIL